MRILDRYIVQEFLKALLLAIGSFIGVYLVVDLFEKLNQFIKAEAEAEVIARYYLLSLPQIAAQVLPASVLLAGLTSLGNLARHHELLAMRIGRMGLFRIVFPPLAIASALSLAAFLAGETLIPRLNEEALTLYRTKVKKVAPYRLTKANDIWYQAEGSAAQPSSGGGEIATGVPKGYRFLHISILETPSGAIRGFTVFELDPDFGLRRRIEAKQASWKEGRWHLEDGYLFRFEKDGAFQVERFQKLPLDLKERPEEFSRVMKLPAEMSSGELRDYIQRLRQSGIDVTRYLVDLHAKGATAFSIVVMALIGIAFGLRVGKAGLLAWAGASIPVGFGYWVLLSLGFAFGRGGLLSPFLAAWLPNLFFALGGLIALLKK